MKAFILVVVVLCAATSYAAEKRLYDSTGNYTGKLVKDSVNPQRERVYDKYGSYRGRIESYGSSSEKQVFDKYGNKTGTIRK